MASFFDGPLLSAAVTHLRVCLSVCLPGHDMLTPSDFFPSWAGCKRALSEMMPFSEGHDEFGYDTVLGG
jgi:hypothetical protein